MEISRLQEPEIDALLAPAAGCTARTYSGAGCMNPGSSSKYPLDVVKERAQELGRADVCNMPDTHFNGTVVVTSVAETVPGTQNSSTMGTSSVPEVMITRIERDRVGSSVEITQCAPEKLTRRRTCSSGQEPLLQDVSRPQVSRLDLSYGRSYSTSACEGCSYGGAGEVSTLSGPQHILAEAQDTRPAEVAYPPGAESPKAITSECVTASRTAVERKDDQRQALHGCYHALVDVARKTRGVLKRLGTLMAGCTSTAADEHPYFEGCRRQIRHPKEPPQALSAQQGVHEEPSRPADQASSSQTRYGPVLPRLALLAQKAAAAEAAEKTCDLGEKRDDQRRPHFHTSSTNRKAHRRLGSSSTESSLNCQSFWDEWNVNDNEDSETSPRGSALSLTSSNGSPIMSSPMGSPCPSFASCDDVMLETRPTRLGPPLLLVGAGPSTSRSRLSRVSS